MGLGVSTVSCSRSQMGIINSITGHDLNYGLSIVLLQANQVQNKGNLFEMKKEMNQSVANE
jgi:hypothetical protein